jgi:hypothetical protein
LTPSVFPRARLLDSQGQALNFAQSCAGCSLVGDQAKGKSPRNSAPPANQGTGGSFNGTSGKCGRKLFDGCRIDASKIGFDDDFIYREVHIGQGSQLV